MNQNQRKFLLEAIEKQYRIEKEKLSEREPKAPSLGNYLTAAILDGSFKMKSVESIRSAIHDRVRDLGKDEALLTDDGDRWSRRNRRNDDSEEVVKLPVEVLFELPENYVPELDKYEKAMAAWEKEIESLEAAINAMRIKVQIGSDKALEVLIDQADKLCSMSLTASSQLMLGNGNKE